MTQCSTVITPTVGKPFVPDSSGKGMRTSGTAAMVVGLDGGAPDHADIRGTGIGFDLNNLAHHPAAGMRE
jgi:hypothetical protein